MTGHVAVVGSANLDTVIRVSTFPRQGETVPSLGMSTSPGGKGANQAVAAARAGGAQTTFIGAVGGDPEGSRLRASMEAEGIRLHLRTLDEVPTGRAIVMVQEDGENRIILVDGANGALTGLTADDRKSIADADVILTQLETPASLAIQAATARRTGATFILNAAPANAIDPELLHAVDVLVVNQPELQAFVSASDIPIHEAAEEALLHVSAVVITLGGSGVYYRDRDGQTIALPGHTVPVKDTTAAGDTFCGVLAASLAARAPMHAALATANAAGALCVGRPGAQDAVPTAADLRRYLATRP